MEPFRKITLTAKSDRSVFAGPCVLSGEWVILTLDDEKEFDLGQSISGNLDCSDGGDFFQTVLNLNTGETVYVCIENWGMTQKNALEKLAQLNSANLITILTNGPHGLVPKSYAV